MHSAVNRHSLENALAAAIRRFDGASPVTPQVHDHFGLAGAGEGDDRLRMQLVLEVAVEEGAAPGAALDAACAIEILHQYALVHEDLVANRARRHERETLWSRFGLAHGINAGDALCAMAYLQLLAGEVDRSPERRVAMTRVLQDAHYAMCAGRRPDLGFAAVPLFGAACQLGALAAGAGDERAGAYARLGRNYGRAMQIEGDVQPYLSEADAFAAAAGIDSSGRVRAFFLRSVRRIAS
jgi:geranylgeranyl diphosphate synthase, type I